MKLIGFSGAKVGTSATLTHIDVANKEAHFVIDDAHAAYKFEGDALDAKLLSKVTISAGGEVSLAGTAEAGKKAVKEKSGSTGNGAAYDKRY
ncbi:hypothetical protein ITP31_003832 [Salmonella enterica]|nr:hypothetical protein [Salmonella enterica]